jgi:Carboxypeptidase regulatory-like domain
MDLCRKPAARHKAICIKSRGRSIDPSVVGQNGRGLVLGRLSLYCLSVVALLLCSFPVLAQPQHLFSTGALDSGLPDTTGTVATSLQQLPAPQSPGTISGRVIDRSGAPVPQAHVRLSRENPSLTQEEITNDDGLFSFVNIVPGPFRLAVSADGFATQRFSGTLLSGETYNVPAVTLPIASTSTEVQVSMSRIEVAEAEIKDEEKQRVLGILPNFYVTYDPDAVPLSSKQKFELAWKATVDPVNFVITAGVAGIEQASNGFGGYGQGAQGYAARYGASYGDLVTGTFIGGAVLPSLLKQDPRYFYKGTGTVKSRILYALATSVICKGDNGHWQANYSAIAGTIVSGAISNAYYPSTDRGAGLVFENALIGIGSSAAGNILQEFVIRKLTPHAPHYTPPPSGN